MSKGKVFSKSIRWGSALVGCSGLGCVFPTLLLMALVVIVLAAASNPVGTIVNWLWAGGPPDNPGQSNITPAGEVRLWTPTPIPESCFITPIPQARLVTPTPGGITDPAVTPPAFVTVWIPTPTPCPPPPNNWATPDPRWTPVPAGYGPHGSPYHSPYWVTQPYGCTDFPEFQDRACALSSGGVRPWFHRGFDMVSRGDKTIFATLAGTVSFSGYAEDGFGLRVYVRSGEFLAIYPHLSRALVATGQSVVWGQPVGIEGSSGYSTGSHLHYQLEVNGHWVDPVPYLYRE